MPSIMLALTATSGVILARNGPLSTGASFTALRCTINVAFDIAPYIRLPVMPLAMRTISDWNSFIPSTSILMASSAIIACPLLA